MQIIFYLSLVVTITTVFVVAIKGFMELLAPIKAAKRAEAELARNGGNS